MKNQLFSDRVNIAAWGEVSFANAEQDGNNDGVAVNKKYIFIVI